MRKLIFVMCVAMTLPLVSAAYWVNDPANCPATDATNFPGQDCSPDNICGDSSGFAQCYDASLLSAPSSNATTSSNVDDGSFDGGYLVNCEVSSDASSPFCDNSGAFWCDRNSACYSTQYRETICLENLWGSYECGDCRSGYQDCYGDTTCESSGSSSCENSANNYYAGSCTCTCDSGYYACDGSISDSDGCEVQSGASCGSGTGSYSGSCYGSVGECTSSTNSDCNNDDSDSDLTTCNGADGCEVTGGASCGSGTGTYENGECLGSVGNCTSAGTNLDCNNDDSDSDELTCNGADGCEVVNNSACSVGVLSGVYSGCSGGVGSCVVSKSYFETGTETSYSTAESLLWGVQYGGGGLINMTNNLTGETFLVNGSGCIIFPDNSSQCSAGGGAANLTGYVSYENATQNVDLGIYNVTTNGTGFFSWLGSLINRVTILFVQDIEASGNINASNYTLNGTTIYDWGDVDTDTQKNATGYLYNDSATIYLNETRLNETIDSRDDSGLWTNLSGIATYGGSINVSGNVTSGEDLRVGGDAYITGTLYGGSPLKLGYEGLSFQDYSGDSRFSIYQAEGFGYNVSSDFANSLIFQTESVNNVDGMEICFWDRENQIMYFCLNEGEGQRATTVRRSFQIVGNVSVKENDENFTLCEGNSFIDCATDSTGADLFVQDDIEAGGSVYAHGDLVVLGGINVSGGFFGNGSVDSENITVNNILSRDGNITFYDNESNLTLIITKEGYVGIGKGSPDYSLDVAGDVQVEVFVVSPEVDVLIDADGSNTTGVGIGGNISDGDVLVAVEADDNLCTDNLTSPTVVFLLINETVECDAGDGTVTTLVGNVSSNETYIVVNSTWSFQDLNGSGTYDDGEDLYIDTVNSLTFDFRGITIPSTTSANISESLYQYDDYLFWDGREVITGYYAENNTFYIDESSKDSETWVIPVPLVVPGGFSASGPTIHEGDVTNKKKVTHEGDVILTGRDGGSILFLEQDCIDFLNGTMFCYGDPKISEDNEYLYYDWLNKRVGIGTDSPNHLLDVDGTANFRAAPILEYITTATTATSGIIPFVGLNKAFRDSGTLRWDDSNSYLGVGTFNTSLEARVHSIGGDVLVTEENPRFLSGISDALCVPGCNLDGAWDVAVEGDYAYVAASGEDDIAIIDISNPNDPEQTNNVLDTFPSSPTGIYVQNGFAYVVSTANDTLYIYDVREPDQGAIYASSINDSACDASVGGLGCALRGPRAVHAVGSYAYVVSSTDGGLSIFDISDKTEPKHISSYYTNLGGAYDIFVQDELAYITTFTSNRLVILDIQDPANPTFVGQYHDNTLLAGANGIKVKDHHAFVVSNGGGSMLALGSLIAIDVEDPANPALSSVFDECPTEGLNPICNVVGPDDVALAGDYAYILVDSQDEIIVVNIKDPTNIEYAGHEAVSSFPTGIAISGKYAYLSVGNNQEFQVFDVSGAKFPGASIGTLEADSIDVNGVVRVKESLISENIETSIKGFTLDRATEGLLYFGGKGGFLGQSASLFWDESSDRLGIGTLQPEDRLHVNAGGIKITPVGAYSIGVIDDGNCDVEFSPTDCPLNGATDVKVQWPYVYVTAADNNGFAIVDVTTPETPLYVNGELDNVSEFIASPTAIEVQENIVYVASGSEHAIGMYDIEDPHNIVYLGAITDDDCDNETEGNGCALRSPQDVIVDGTYAYVLSYADSGVGVFDISKPYEPKHVASIFDNTSSALLTSPFDMELKGSRLYVTSSSDDSLVALDVSDSGSLEHKWSLSDSTVMDGAFAVKIKGHYAYVSATISNSISVVDISDDTGPVVVASFNESDCTATCGLDSPNGLAVAGDYLYVINGGVSDGVLVLDISNPLNITFVDFIEDDPTILFAEPSAIEIVGKYAYITTSAEDGLTVLDLDGLKTPSAEIGTLAVDQLTVKENANILGSVISNELIAGRGGITTQGNLIVNGEEITVNDGNVIVKENSPFEVATFTDNQCDSEFGSECTIANSQDIEIEPSGEHIYISSFSDNGVIKINVNDPTNPTPVDSIVSSPSVNLNGAADMMIITNYNSDETKSPANSGGDSSGEEILIVMAKNDNAVTVLATNDDKDVDSDSDTEEMSVLGSLTNSDCDVQVGGAGCALSEPSSMGYFYDVDGDLVLVGSDGDNGIAILDVSKISQENSEISHITSIFDDSSSRLQDPTVIEVLEDYAFVASGSEDAVNVIDLSNRQNPEVVDVIENGVDGAQLDNPLAFEIRGEYMYIASNDADAVEVYDITNPENAQYVTRLQDTSKLGEVQELESTGNILLASGINGIAEIDITLPEQPKIVGMIHDDLSSGRDAPGDSDVGTSEFIAHVSSIKVDRGYVYAVSETENALTVLGLRRVQAPAGVFDNLYIRGDIGINGDIHTDDLDIHGDVNVVNNLESRRLSVEEEISTNGNLFVNDGDIIQEAITLYPIDGVNDGGSGELNGAYDIALSEDGDVAFVIALEGDALTAIDVSDSSNMSILYSINNAACDVAVGGTGCALDWPTAVVSYDDYVAVSSHQEDGITLFLYDEENQELDYAVTLFDGECDNAFGVDGCPLGKIEDMDIEGNFIYTVNDETLVSEDQGLGIIEIGEDGFLTFRGRLNDDNATSLDGLEAIEVEDDIAYVGSDEEDAVTLINVSDKENPVIISSISTATLANVRNPEDIKYHEGHIYVAGRTNDAISVIDVTTPTIPAEVNSITAADVSGDGFTDLQRVDAVGDTLIVTAKNGNAVHMFNVNDPANPIHLSTLQDNENLEIGGANGIVLGEDTMYITGETDDGVQSFDMPVIGAMIGQIDNIYADDISSVSGDFDTLEVQEKTTLYEQVDINGDVTQNNGRFVQKIDGNALSQVASLADSVSTALLGAADAVISGGFAYVASEDEDALSVVDISDPTNLRQVGSITDSSERLLNRTNAVDVSGDIAVVTSFTEDGISIIDITDPTDLEVIGQLDDSECNYQAELTCPFVNVVDVEIEGDYVYVASIGENGIGVIDISDPESPQFVTSIIDSNCDREYGSCALNDPVDIEIDGNYLYVASHADDGMSVFDVSDPYLVDYVVSLTDNANRKLDGASSVEIKGNYAVLTSDIEDAVVLINISDPSNPTYLDDLENGDCDERTPAGCALDGATDVAIVDDIVYVAATNENGITAVQITPEGRLSFMDTLFDSGSTLLSEVSSVAAGSGNVLFTAAGAAESGIALFQTPAFVSPSANIERLEAKYADILYRADIGGELNVFDDAYVGGDLQSEGLTVRDRGIYSLGDIEVSSGLVYVTSYMDDECDSHEPSGNCGLNEPSGITVQGDYLYVSDSLDDRLSIFDISYNGIPRMVGSITDTGVNSELNGAQDVVLVGDYAYVPSSDGLAIIDVSDKMLPVEVGNINDADCDVAEGGSNCALVGRKLYVEGDYLYYAGTSNLGFAIVNISDPTNPEHLDSIFFGGTSDLNTLTGVYVQDGYAYVVSRAFDVLAVLDVSDSNDITYVREILHDNSTVYLDNPQDLIAKDNYLYVASETSDAIMIFDISNPGNPVAAGYVLDDAEMNLNAPYDLFISENQLYVGADDTVLMFDMINATNLSFVDEVENKDGRAMNDVSGVAATVDYVYSVSDGTPESENGLVVMSRNKLEAPYAEIDRLRVAHSLDTVGDMGVGGDLDISGDLSVAGDIDTIFSEGSVIFTDADGVLSRNTGQFFWDINNSRLGIGTDIPATPLEIEHASNPTLRLQAQGGNPSNAGSIEFSEGTNTTQFTIRHDGDANALRIETDTNDRALAIKRETGRVGIGTLSPATELDVIGNVTADYFLGDGSLLTNISSVWNESDGNATFVGGNVGIGTLTPEEILTISGGDIFQYPGIKGVVGGLDNTSLGAPMNVEVSGNYLLIGDHSDKIIAVDVTDKDNPVITFELVNSTFINNPVSLVVSGSVGLVASNSAKSVTVFDITDKQNMEILGTVNLSSYANHIFTGYSFVEGNYAYFSFFDFVGADDGFIVIDISDPSQPFVSSTIFSDEYFPNGGGPIFVENDYLYTVPRLNQTFMVIDISDMNNISIIASLENETYFDSAGRIEVQDRYAYVSGIQSNSFSIIDISNKSNPYITGAVVDNVTLNNPRGFVVAEDYVYIASQLNNSIQIIDISNKSNPTIIDSFGNESNLPAPVTVDIIGKHLYVSSLSSASLTILELGGSSLPTAEIGSLETGSLLSDEVAIRNILSVGSSVVVDGGVVSADYFLGDGSELTGINVLWNDSNGNATFVGGNVGIGTATPTVTLDVNGSAIVTGNFTADYFIGNGSLLTGINSGLWNDSNGNATFVGGSVGIGTTTPNATLDVNGTVTAAEFIGDGSGITGINSGLWKNESDIAVYNGSAKVKTSFIYSDETTQYVASTPNGNAWHLSTASPRQSEDISTEGTIETGVFFNPQGTKMYVSGYNTDTINEYDLSRPWDVTTATYNDGLLITDEGTPRDLYISPDGLKLYTIGTVHDAVDEYDIGVAWDITTAVYSKTEIVYSVEGTPYGLFFKPDGTKMYVIGSEFERVSEYDLSVPWDLDTASYERFKDVSSEDLTPSGVTFSPDGRRMYVVGEEHDAIYEYVLTTPWLVTSAVFNTAFNVTNEPHGVFVSTDGTSIFTVSPDSETVDEFSLGLVSFGKIGIGTDSPNHTLDVRGNVSGNYFIGDGSLLTNISSVWNDSDGNATFVGGNVGIGTGIPNTTLDVNGTVTATAFVGDGSGLTGIDVGNSLWANSSGNATFVGGNVGIGVNDPSRKFVVSKDGANPTITGGVDSNIATVLTSSGYTGFGIMASNSTASFMHFGDTDDANIGKIDYFHSDDSMRFTTNTGERVRIDSDGDVGIGTDDPIYNLHIRDSGDAVIGLSSGSGSTYTMYKDESTDNFVIREAGEANRFVISNEGDIGVGTDSPSGKLHLNDSNDTISFITASGADKDAYSVYGLPDDNQYWSVGASDGTDNFLISYGVTEPSGIIKTPANFIISTDGSVGIRTLQPQVPFHILETDPYIRLSSLLGGDETGGTIQFAEGNTGVRFSLAHDSDADTLSINSSTVDNIFVAQRSTGNIGIGIDNPGQKFVVSKDGTNQNITGGIDSNIAQVITSSGFTGLGIMASNSTASFIHFGDSDDGNIGKIDYFHSDESMRFTTNNDEAMRIDSAGDVGIGESNPLVKLHITDAADTTVLRLEDSDGTCNYNPESGAVTVSCSSDEILKEDIHEAEDVLDELEKIQIKDYKIKESGDNTTGVIAQEINETNPEMVHVVEVLDEETNEVEELLFVEQPNPWKLLKAIQELKEMVDSLVGGNYSVEGASVFDEDMVGTAVVEAGETEAYVEFGSEYRGIPVVTLTPLDFIEGQYRVANKTTGGFVIELQNLQDVDVGFDWHAFGVDEEDINESDVVVVDVVVNESVEISEEFEIVELESEENFTGKEDMGVNESYIFLNETEFEENLGLNDSIKNVSEVKVFNETIEEGASEYEGVFVEADEDENVSEDGSGSLITGAAVRVRDDEGFLNRFSDWFNLVKGG